MGEVEGLDERSGISSFDRERKNPILG